MVKIRNLKENFICLNSYIEILKIEKAIFIISLFNFFTKMWVMTVCRAIDTLLRARWCDIL